MKDTVIARLQHDLKILQEPLEEQQTTQSPTFEPLNFPISASKNTLKVCLAFGDLVQKAGGIRKTVIEALAKSSSAQDTANLIYGHLNEQFSVAIYDQRSGSSFAHHNGEYLHL